MLPRITDYWDSTSHAVDSFAKEIGSLPPVERDSLARDLGAAVREHMRVVPDQMIPAVATAVADDLYKQACWIDRWDTALELYLRASAGTFWSSFAERGFVLHQLIDNSFEELDRPLVLFPDWFGSCGIAYVCPQALAVQLIQGSEPEDASVAQLLPRYIAEARDLTESIVSRCQAEERHYCLLDLDFDERSFRSSLDKTGGNVLTTLRNQAAQPGTEIAVWPPTRESKGRPESR
jgi:hypothetical protein